MLPRLTALQWIILFVFLFFYGFSVFALTRDYYLRHAPRSLPNPPASQQAPNAEDSALGERMRQALTGEPEDSQAQIDIGSTDTGALGHAADRLFAARRFVEAIPIYQRVLELQPKDAETHNDLGLALHYVGRAEEAISTLKQGTELAPDFQRIWLSLGFVALQNDQPALARDALQRALALDPDTDIADEATRLLRIMETVETQP
jgi:Flp pilus assembly protein TadD